MKNTILVFALALGLISPAFAQSPFVQEGIASYYADSFQGRPTKSGQLYDKNKFTAAHQTLPMGTEVEVINQGNGKSVVVVINDFGPHTKSRIIDLSRIAAEQIDMINMGLASVVIREIPKAISAVSPTTTTPTPTTTTTTAAPATTVATAPAAQSGEVILSRSEVYTIDANGEKVVVSEAPATVAVTTPQPVPVEMTTPESAPVEVVPNTVAARGPVVVQSTNKIITKLNALAPSTKFTLQLGLFSDLKNAKSQLDVFNANGMSGSIMLFETWKDGKKVYKIIEGNYMDREAANKRKDEFKKWYAIDSFVVKVR